MKTAQFQVLSDEDIRQIQDASLSILEETGIIVHHRELLELLTDSGAQVDFERESAKIPSHIVERALANVPAQVVLCDRERNPSVVLGDGHTYSACGHGAINFLDHHAGRRLSTKSDVANLFKIADALDTISVVAPPAIPQDVRPESCFLHAIDAGFTNSRKHLYVALDTISTARAALNMARIVAGSDDLAALPIISIQQSIQSPLTWPEDMAAIALEVVRARVPICFHTAPLAGVSGPITLAGLLALYNAEVLSGVIISQLIRKGAPVIYGGGWGTFDLKSANRVLGAPEGALQVVAGTQLARAYGIPTHAIGPDTDAHCYDEQVGWEKMLKAVCAICSGVSLLVNASMFDIGMTVSYEQLILDNEMLEIAYRFAEGISVNEDTLALDVIKRVCPKGDFLTEEHTLRYLRSGEHWEPKVSNRNSFAQWEELASPDIVQRAGQMAQKILETHHPAELENAKQRELTRLIQIFEEHQGQLGSKG